MVNTYIFLGIVAVHRLAFAEECVAAGETFDCGHIAIVVNFLYLHGLTLIGQRGDLVLLPCDVGVDGPAEIAGLHGNCTEFEADTTVHHVTNVSVVTAVTVGHRQREVHKHILGGTVEAFEVTADTVVQETEFNAGAEVAVLFP